MYFFLIQIWLSQLFFDVFSKNWNICMQHILHYLLFKEQCKCGIITYKSLQYQFTKIFCSFSLPKASREQYISWNIVTKLGRVFGRYSVYTDIMHWSASGWQISLLVIPEIHWDEIRHFQILCFAVTCHLFITCGRYMSNFSALEWWQGIPFS